MNRIDYRFYRTKKQEMVYGFGGCSTTYVLGMWENEIHVSEPMQYTGLRDMIKTKIYESDYVRGFHRNFEVGNLVEVTFLNGCFMFGTYNAHEFFNMHQHIEVIGNLYENPELLEVD